MINRFMKLFLTFLYSTLFFFSAPLNATVHQTQPDTTTQDSIGWGDGGGNFGGSVAQDQSTEDSNDVFDNPSDEDFESVEPLGESVKSH